MQQLPCKLAQHHQLAASVALPCVLPTAIHKTRESFWFLCVSWPASVRCCMRVHVCTHHLAPATTHDMPSRACLQSEVSAPGGAAAAGGAGAGGRARSAAAAKADTRPDYEDEPTLPEDLEDEEFPVLQQAPVAAAARQQPGMAAAGAGAMARWGGEGVCKHVCVVCGWQGQE